MTGLENIWMLIPFFAGAIALAITLYYLTGAKKKDDKEIKLGKTYLLGTLPPGKKILDMELHVNIIDEGQVNMVVGNVNNKGIVESTECLTFDINMDELNK